MYVSIISQRREATQVHLFSYRRQPRFSDAKVPNVTLFPGTEFVLREQNNGYLHSSLRKP